MPAIVDAVTIILQPPPPPIPAVTIILQPPPPPIPAVDDSATVILQPTLAPTSAAAPGQPMPVALPPSTSAPSPVQSDTLEMPCLSANPTAPAPTGSYDDCPRCCSLYFQYVNVYYWPVASSNTDCLSIVSSQTHPPFPNGYDMYFSTANLSRIILLTAF